MVCIYCGHETRVINSRLQKRTNGVWRRRHCTACQAIFTSVEQAEYPTSFLVRDGTSHIMPFERDILFLSLYEACRHRPHAVHDAASLADTIIQKVLRSGTLDGAIDRSTLRAITYETLGNFDHAAQVHYGAFHAKS